MWRESIEEESISKNMETVHHEQDEKVFLDSEEEAIVSFDDKRVSDGRSSIRVLSCLPFQQYEQYQDVTTQNAKVVMDMDVKPNTFDRRDHLQFRDQQEFDTAGKRKAGSRDNRCVR